MNSLAEMYLKAVEKERRDRKIRDIPLPERNQPDPKYERCKKCGRKAITKARLGTFNFETLQMTGVKRGPFPKTGVQFFHREKGLYELYQLGEYAYSFCFKCMNKYWNHNSRYVDDQEKFEANMKLEPDMR